MEGDLRMSIRSRIAPILDLTGSLDLAGHFSRQFGSRQLTILMYHRVNVPGVEPLTNPRVISTTPDEFDEQMKWLARNCCPIRFSDLTYLKASNRPLPKRSVIVTFDDGYWDNYLYAFPILQRHRVPATIFLVTGHVGKTVAFWWERVTAQLKARNYRVEEIVLEIERLLHLPDEKREAEIREIDAAGVEAAQIGRTSVNWEEVREMSSAGIEFGGHTVNHPVLSRLTPSTLFYEVGQCKRDIEEKIGKKVETFAYPVGRSFSVNREAVDAVRAAGYKYAVTTSYGINRPGEWNPLLLKRIGIFLGDELPRFKAKLLVPRYFGPRATNPSWRLPAIHSGSETVPERLPNE
jgi:peptidoglycan/xylan/chitin deacetylase (PgdA/CDA1 family)